MFAVDNSEFKYAVKTFLLLPILINTSVSILMALSSCMLIIVVGVLLFSSKTANQ